MPRFRLFLLLVGAWGLGDCAAPPTAVPEAAAPEAEGVLLAQGTGGGGSPGPDPLYRAVQSFDLDRQPTRYAATLLVLDEADGFVHLRVQLNPQTHKVNQITLLGIPRRDSVSYHHLGEGVARYDSLSGHYYFTTFYQKRTKLANGYQDNGLLQQITGWVQPESAEAALRLKAME
ncbi:hypothetical protein ACW9KT_19290 [Hymenobacter sp. HD11105]